ncbi:MAG TPA: diaminopimelate epimerase [Candidatus Aquilonibacter sp.]|nr:diaminopimelate epimerase [Candidatus Aquilonibacter sp.]
MAARAVRLVTGGAARYVCAMRFAFTKYHALGNDYIVIEPKHLPSPLTAEQVRIICHRNFGVGSDGILLGPLPSKKAPFGLRIFNPDGSEAEKSGNGLRIFSRYLWDKKAVGKDEFSVETKGGVVRATVLEKGKIVRVEMGRVSFWSDEIPVAGPRREVINEPIHLRAGRFNFCAATVGNPHCVLPLPKISADFARLVGPQLETHARFPNRTNVQLMQVLDRENIRIEIWERGAGYTLASGSSSSAAAAVAHKLGLCDRAITVHMPGGKIEIEIGDGFAIRMTGAVTKVAEGVMSKEMFGVGSAI